MTVTVVAGNPKPGSRTLAAAGQLAEQITGAPADHAVDVVTLGPGLLGWGDEGVAAAVKTVQGSELIIVASPTFKATYSGVLKLFLDQFASGDGLAGVVAVPLMLGAGPAHALAPELLLKPVLVELGATVPVQGLYLNQESWQDPDSSAAWLEKWRLVIQSLL